MFLGHPDPSIFYPDLDPEPDHSVNKQKSKKNLDFCNFVTSF